MPKRYQNPTAVTVTGRHVRGKGVVYGHRMLPGRVRANIRLGRGLPQKVSTEHKSTLYCPPNAQGVVTLISQRVLPSIDRTGLCNGGVNRQLGTVAATGELQLSNAPEPFDVYKQYTSTASIEPEDVLLNHRSDWTMFTNHAWRDGMAYCNTRFTTTAQAATGYCSPYMTGMHDGSHIDSDGLGWAMLTGASTGTGGEWWKGSYFTEAPSVSSGAGGPAAHPANQGMTGTGALAAGNLGVAGLLNTDNYYHISEELSWHFMNNGDTPVTITIYEHILNRDVPMIPTPSKGTRNATTGEWTPGRIVNDGGLPCPIELWRQSREKNFHTIPSDSMGVRPGDFGIIPAERETVGRTMAELSAIPYGRIAATATTGAGTNATYNPERDEALNSPAITGAGAGPTDIDYPGVTPRVAALLHTWYKVKAHTRTINPGQETTITVHVRFNKKIPGSWWYQFYGIRDLTRCFTLVTRPDKVIGKSTDETSTSVGVHARLPVMGQTDIAVTWYKKKQMAIAGQRFRGSRYFRATAVPAFTKFAVRDPADADEELAGDEL